MTIRYDKKLNTEINRVIKNFNQKIARLEKDERELLPDRIRKTVLKDSVKTRAELYRKLKELQRFSVRGAEDIITTKGGITLTRYELSNIKREKARIQRNISLEMNKLEKQKPKIFGKEQSSTYSQMGDVRYLNLKATRNALNKNINKLNPKELKKVLNLLSSIKKKSNKNENGQKENYISMIDYMCYFYDYDSSKWKEIKEKLIDLSPNDLIRLFNEERSFKALLEYYYTIKDISNLGLDYDSIKNDVKGLLDNVYSHIDEILEDYA